MSRAGPDVTIVSGNTLIPALDALQNFPTRSYSSSPRFLVSAVMPSELESAMESLIMVFHRYADKDGRGETLSKKELKQLMETELASFLKSQKDPATIDKIMKDLDQNGDGEVSFEEFVSLVVGLSIACEQIYQIHIKKTATKK
ncbi:hypothetical protein DPEC_G00142290 [Dallia pectoralis]|uniref:Uncharacterized protein n=1 Tax=Dallia pectoralis TaxID=75939 RepID=A0ACC2GNK7_DALPE|nr:hypothetical protein DPEC_G00142290 [Dallia pectoralis]